MKNIIDIRSSDKYNINHIPGAINIEYLELLSNPSSYLNKNDTYYLYCTSGIRSKKATELLSILGYRVINVKDGYKDKLL